ncbi:MAG: TetR/AcrR family transcriptional regulator [Candidatus Microthrix sp.]|nr:TetR/AcrR family transcriptional regulator [Candidatus Microthrix sp.]
MTTPAPPTDRRRERHLAKRAMIVAEAWTLARRDGLAAISLRDLADRVGLRQPSLYAYFDSKLALYDAMFADGNRQLIETVSALPEHDDPTRRSSISSRSSPDFRRPTPFATSCSSSAPSPASSRPSSPTPSQESSTRSARNASPLPGSANPATSTCSPPSCPA